MRLRAALAGLALLLPAQAPAQPAEPLPLGQVQSPVLTLDVERLFAETLYGRRVNSELRARAEALQAENDRLAAELTARERGLTEGRPGMEPDAFRAAADAFDADVQRIRAEQDAKEAALEDALAQERQRFLNDARPVLARLMIERGAAVILERRAVFLSVSLVDVTDEAIAALDAQLGDGSAAPAPGSTPDPAPVEAAPDAMAPSEPGAAPDADAAPATPAAPAWPAEGEASPASPAPPPPGDGG